MYEGQIVQFGTPRELFEKPNHTFVGYFIGSPGMNITEVKRIPDGVLFDDIEVPLSPALNEIVQASPSKNIKIGIRPEFVRVSQDPTEGAYQARVMYEEDLGTYKVLSIQLGQWELKAIIEENAVSPKGVAYVNFPSQWLKLYIDEYLVEDNLS